MPIVLNASLSLQLKILQDYCPMWFWYNYPMFLRSYCICSFACHVSRRMVEYCEGRNQRGTNKTSWVSVHKNIDTGSWGTKLRRYGDRIFSHQVQQRLIKVDRVVTAMALGADKDIFIYRVIRNEDLRSIIRPMS